MVSDGSVASNPSVAVVNTGDDSPGTTIGHLPDGVRLSLPLPVVDSSSVARVADSGDNTNVVRVPGGISVGQGKPVSNLSDGVSISFPLSIVAAESMIARVADSGDNADVVGMAGGVGIGNGEAISHLAEGVSL